MKLLMIIDNMDLGGAQRMFAFVANGLSRYYDVYLISYASNKSFFHLNDEVHYIAGSDYNGSGLLRHIKKIPFLYKKIKKIGPDVILTFMTIPALLSKIASVFSGIPVIFCERGDPYQYKTFIQKIKLKSVIICNYAVFQTIQARDYYPQRLIKNSTIIPNPVVNPNVERAMYENRNNNIAFVGRFDIHQKRQDLVVDAFKLVVEKHPEMILLFCGDGDDLEIIKKKVETMNISDNVVFKGKVKDVKIELLNCKAYVISSDYEGIPNSLIEAMSLGIPCVSTDCSPGGARMLINNMENGILVPCNNSKALANAIIYIIEHPIEADEMGKNAMKIVDLYSENLIMQKWMSVINHCCSNH